MIAEKEYVRGHLKELLPFMKVGMPIVNLTEGVVGIVGQIDGNTLFIHHDNPNHNGSSGSVSPRANGKRFSWSVSSNSYELVLIMADINRKPLIKFHSDFDYEILAMKDNGTDENEIFGFFQNNDALKEAVYKEVTEDPSKIEDKYYAYVLGEKKEVKVKSSVA